LLASGGCERPRILRQVSREIRLQYLVVGHRSALRSGTRGDKQLRENPAISGSRSGRPGIEQSQEKPAAPGEGGEGCGKEVQSRESRFCIARS